LRFTGRLLLILALSSLGCARGDWTTETLTLVDLTGTWEGSFGEGTAGASIPSQLLSGGHLR